MNWDAISAFAETVGAAAVVATLLYLAIQIRAQTKESRLAATRDLSRDYLDAIDSITRDKEVFSVYLKALAAYEDLPYEERVRISMAFIRIFRVLELSYSHYLSRDIEAAHFESGQVPVKELMEFPGIRAWWERNCHLFGEEFQVHVKRFFSDDENKEQ